MDKSPYFDPIAARHRLTEIFKSSANEDEARPQIVEELKAFKQHARQRSWEILQAEKDGPPVAKGLSEFQDELTRLIFDYTVAHVYRATNPSEAERMSIVATGGYGRGLLAPGSDIDLLFLLPYKKVPWSESVAEYMLYMLWDLGFKVGHATRTVDQCVKLGRADITIRTALLDARLIHGDAQLFGELQDRFQEEVVQRTAREFIDAKMSEREERIKRAGNSRYKVEPNIKDGKGGLRDLHTLHWLSKYIFGQDVGPAAVEAGVFTAKEVQTFQQCEDFLWTVRCFLHFMTGRPEEILTFDLQTGMARSLGYKAHPGLRPVERFMKHYFLVAKEVGDLTTILCGALEMQQLKSVRTVGSLLRPTSWRARSDLRQKTDFRVDNDRLNISDPDIFKRDPVNIIRIFLQSEVTGGLLHPNALRRLRQSARNIDDELRGNPEANRLFLEILTKSQNPEVVLRRMNECGILGRFLPDFGRIVSMMQFNMYHHYTVDEHLVRTVGNLTEIEKGSVIDELPLSSDLIKSIKNRRALYVAAFLHDIGKGRDEDHSLVGAEIARKVCPRFGLGTSETELVAWLIEEHLTMSNFAFSRDISDPKTVSDFADIVQSPERLKLLMLLTVADIRAVGPGVWNGWKGQLIRSLYYEVEPRVAGGHTLVERSRRIETAKQALREALSDWQPEDVDTFIERHYPNYWLRTDTAVQVRHAHLIADAERQQTKFATNVVTDAFTDVTELTIFAPNHPRLLSLFAGSCSAVGCNIASAQIMTTRDGFALDTFFLNREFDYDSDELRKGQRVADTITRQLEGRGQLSEMMKKKKKRQSNRRFEVFTVEPEVIISNSISDRLTVIEVTGRDRPGLLQELTSEMSDLSLDIGSAHISTFGEKVVDVFYVTDLVGKQITAEPRQETIRKRLTEVLEGTSALRIKQLRHAE